MLNDSTSNIKLQSKEAAYLKEVDVFIWDEAPMSPKYGLTVMNKLLQSIMGNNKLFGGKIVVLGGDFRQLLPVLVRGTRAETLNLSIKYSSLWNSFKLFPLHRNMRALPEEQEFAKFVLDVGNGTLNDNNDNLDLQIPEQCVSYNFNASAEIFGNYIKERKFSEMSKCAILSARNVDVDEINKEVVKLLDPNGERIYTSVDSADNIDDNGEMANLLLPEYLNSLNPASLPPNKLHLRRNAIIMLIRNISINEGLCNGTRLRVLDLSNNLIKCEILTGDKSGEVVFLNRITLICDDEYPFTFKRRQFPVKLAFAMTINKSQGQTFNKIGIDLRRDVFNHGQLYVAISRVRSWNSLKIYLGSHRQNKIVKNNVYKELYEKNY